MRIGEKVAIVTGSAQGIGKAIAQRLALEGVTVAVADMIEDLAKTTSQEIGLQGGKAIPVKMDITNSKEVKEAVEQVLKQCGRIDILVNNAGWDKIEPFVQSDEETWDKVIAINYKGPVIVTRVVLDNMIGNKYGRIVSIASDAGRVGSTGEAVYSGCKGGIIAFSKTLAREVVRYNITVNCVSPGPTGTPNVLKFVETNPKMMEALTGAIPMKRLAHPEEIAAAVLFLASDAAGYITGQVLSVSGGLTMC
ncbi:MAG: 2-hydroxycyclohexanecarboxyl-CoA dehydrogenase [Chloroflexi bacterium RBG_13_54_8]|nr:MAG: 2-hydroxycyclohexanecarboxyl-CoA dehydrogenase [Chloroflexi bacterium RBG_13_54_8]